MNNIKIFLRQNWFLVLSFIYIVSPIDLIPGDMATGIGLIDDIGVLLGTAIYMFVRFLMDGKESSTK
jgi:uncharacterized membrane protein YkvA (DUF1232 family)